MLKKRTGLKTVKEYIRAIAALNVKIERAIVFGSFSKNQLTEDSDIDVALISDDFTDYPLADCRKIAKANIRFPIIEPHTFSKKYFEKGDPFINEIKKTGIEVRI